MRFAAKFLLGTLLLAAAGANLVFLIRIAVAYWIAWPGDTESLVRAAARLPYTADSYAPDLSLQAGHLLDTQGQIEEGLRFYRASLAHDPYNAPAWLLVAIAEERLGHAAKAEQAYRSAFRYEPNHAEGYWMYANFLLRQERLAESLTAFRRVLERGREYDQAVFDTTARMAGAEELERNVVPRNSPAELSYVRFALGALDARATRRMWTRLAARAAELEPAEITALCQLWTGAGDFDGAHAAWVRWATARGHQPTGPVNNGGFDSEPAGGPYDWVFHPATGVEGSRDTSVYLTPGASAHLLFSGSGDFEGTAIEQWLHLKPGHRYQLSFAWRARNLTTHRAPCVEVWANGRIAGMEAEPGTWPWRRETLRFVAPAKLVRLVVARRPSANLDNRIAGDFWLDGFQLSDHPVNRP